MCIALSHLQLWHWPTSASASASASAHDRASAAVPEDELASSPDSLVAPGQHITPVPSHIAGSGLQVLGLHNCTGLAPEGLQVIASACPQLRLLFLGGSAILVPKQSPTDRSSHSTYIPMLNSIPRCRAAIIGGVIRKAPSCHHPSAHLIAAQLVGLVLQLPQLLLLEITFFPHGVHAELQALLADRSCNTQVHILDLCESKGITAAIEYGSRTGVHGMDGSARDLKCSNLKMHLALLLEAAANCSNAARQTPLHVAADADDVGAVQVRSGKAPTILAAARKNCLAAFLAPLNSVKVALKHLLAAFPLSHYALLQSHHHTVLGLLHRGCCSWAVG